MATEPRLGIHAQRVLKIIHMLLAACIFGALLSIEIILLLKAHYPFGATVFAADLSVLKIFTYGVSYAFGILVFTAVIYGLFTPWGFITHKWILIKLIIVIAVLVVTVTGLGPAISGMASISDAGLSSTTMHDAYIKFGQQALVLSSVNILLIGSTFTLSSIKPFGKTKWEINSKIARRVLLPLLVILLVFAVHNTVKHNEIRNMPIGEIHLSNIRDGIYDGSAAIGSYTYHVKVTVQGHQIKSIRGIDNRKSPYVTYAEGVFPKIIQQQKADVDAVTGATTTSKAFMKAVENALHSSE